LNNPCRPEWWYDIVDGLPAQIVKESFIDVWDAPGLGITFNANAKKYPAAGDERFFD
jgi:L-alanine-DL-glutamate epimerase-like enolase superfamily enzyme